MQRISHREKKASFSLQKYYLKKTYCVFCGKSFSNILVLMFLLTVRKIFRSLFFSSSMDGRPRPTFGCPSVLRLLDVYGESETPYTSGEGEHKFTKSFSYHNKFLTVGNSYFILLRTTHA